MRSLFLQTASGCCLVSFPFTLQDSLEHFLQGKKFGRFSGIISSNLCPILSSPSETQMMYVLLCLMVPYSVFLRLYSLFTIFFSSSSDLLISVVLYSSSQILSYACLTLPLNPSSEIFALVIAHFRSRICFWFLFRFSISLLIFTFCSHIVFLISPHLPLVL